MPTRRQLLLSAAAMGTAGVGALSGCSRDGSRAAELEEGDTLRMRVWDEAAARAYESSLDAFAAASGITVEVEVISWEDYWEKLPLDMAAGTLPDVLWMNTAYLAQAHASEALLEIGELAGQDSAQWEPMATDLYRFEDGLWGVPQLWDQSLLIAHDELVEEAGVDPSDLSFDPEADTDALREAARALTVDAEGRHPGDDDFDAGTREVFGFSAHLDRTAVLGPFLAGLGGTWQDEEGGFTFASEQGVAAVQYLADLAGADLAPDGAETAQEPSKCLSLFLEGKLGLLQTGTYDLGSLASGIDGSFPWSIHPVVAGPQGPRPLVHAISAVGVSSDDEERDEAVAELLTWLGGAEGQRPLAESRLGIPAHRELRGTWQEAWNAEGVDVTPLENAPEDVALPESGVRSSEGTGAALEIIAEVFEGETDAADALPRAEQAAREASE